MRYKSFEIQKNGKEYYLTRNEFPKVTLVVNCSREIAVVKDLVLVDDCSASNLAEVLSEVETFIQGLKCDE